MTKPLNIQSFFSTSMLIIMLALLLCTCGCMSSGNRRFMGTNIVGADVDTARESTSTIIQTEVVQGNIKSIESDAKAITKQAQVESVVVLGQNIESRARESKLILKNIHSNLESIHQRSLGKTYWSKSRLLIVWVVGLLGLGLLVRFLPFFQPVHRAISGVANMLMDGVRGTYRAVQDVKLEHLDKTSTIANEDMPNSVRAEIKKAEARKLEKFGDWL